MTDSPGCPSFLSHPGHQRIFRRWRRRVFHRVGGKVFSGNGVWICLPAIGKVLGAAGGATSPWRSRWHLHRHTGALKQNPAVFRPRAARTDDGARRPAGRPRFFRCRRAEPIVPRGCPWRIRTHAATGSSNRPPQCFSQVKLRSVAGCVTTLPPVSAGVFPSSDACVRE